MLDINRFVHFWLPFTEEPKKLESVSKQVLYHTEKCAMKKYVSRNYKEYKFSKPQNVKDSAQLFTLFSLEVKIFKG